MPKQKQDEQFSEQQEHELPRGLKLVGILEGHKSGINNIVFNQTGQMLASGSHDRTVKLWDVATGRLLRTLEGHVDKVKSVAFDSTGQMLASGSSDNTAKLWDVATGRLLHTLEGHSEAVFSVAFDPTGQTIASCSYDRKIKLWDVASSRLLRTFEGHVDGILIVAFNPTGQMLASGSYDRTVKLWDVATGRLLRTLEGHTGSVDAVAFSLDGRLLASKSDDGTLRLWSCETWETIAVIPELTNPVDLPNLAFHPTLPLLATVGSNPDAVEEELCTLIHFWELDFDVLLGNPPKAKATMKAVQHTTAKVVLVGDSGVGKTGLGWRLAHGEFKEHSSTHGQQFWVVNELGAQRDDGTECEAILWDLAGQPDYRLTHALFLDDADLALVLFDPTDSRDPLHGVELAEATQSRFDIQFIPASSKRRREGDCVFDDISWRSR